MSVVNTDPLATPDPDRPGYVIHNVGWLQRVLNRLGFCVGAQDGFWGDRTQGGLDRYLTARRLPAGAYYVNGPQTMEVMLQQQVSTALSREQLPATSRCTQQRQVAPPLVAPPLVDSKPKTAYIIVGVGAALLVVVGAMWLVRRKR